MGFNGSSPRLRGTGSACHFDANGHRFIPAPAGNRRLSLTNGGRRTVHPRACGEQWVSIRSRAPSTGSSPRLRGTAWRRGFWINSSRFIPAPAGNSKPVGRPRPGESVHPRACGEQAPRRKSAPSSDGSSPRLRGTATSRRFPLRFVRFIPAPAGNSWRSCPPSRWRSVHPRACGEQRTTNKNDSSIFGSSPRLRGTVYAVGLGGDRSRFIPAPAGNRPGDR